jgi:hypothetical protein
MFHINVRRFGLRALVTQMPSLSDSVCQTLISHLNISSHALCNTRFCADYEFAYIRKEKMAVLKSAISIATLAAPPRPVEFLVFGEVSSWVSYECLFQLPDVHIISAYGGGCASET